MSLGNGGERGGERPNEMLLASLFFGNERPAFRLFFCQTTIAVEVSDLSNRSFRN